MKKTTQKLSKKPAAKQHILVAVTGNTPQIVTETLYVLAVAWNPPVPIAQQRLDRPAPNRLLIDLPRGQAKFGSQTIALRGVKMALLAYYADAKISHCVEPDRPVCGDCQACFTNPTANEARFQSFYRQLYTGSREQLEEGHEGKLDSAILMSNHTKINKALLPVSIKIDSQRQWGGTTYGLNLDKNLIEVIR